MTLKTDLYLLDNTLKPSDINLQINQTSVSDQGDSINQGFWVSETELSSPTGELDYVVSADWWDVQCNIHPFIKFIFLFPDFKSFNIIFTFLYT